MVFPDISQEPEKTVRIQKELPYHRYDSSRRFHYLILMIFYSTAAMI